MYYLVQRKITSHKMLLFQINNSRMNSSDECSEDCWDEYVGFLLEGCLVPAIAAFGIAGDTAIQPIAGDTAIAAIGIAGDTAIAAFGIAGDTAIQPIAGDTAIAALGIAGDTAIQLIAGDTAIAAIGIADDTAIAAF